MKVGSTLLAAAALAIMPLGRAETVSDAVFLNDAAGTTRTGRVTAITAESLRLEVPLDGVAGGTMTVSIPRSQIRSIEFAPEANRDALLDAPTPADLHELRALWNAWEPHIALAKSPAPRVGNIYGTLLLATQDPERAAEALTVFKTVESEAWDEAARRSARRGRLRAMVATGNAADAVTEAKQLAGESNDSEVLIEAKFILAEAARERLTRLEEENPRWMEDLFVRPERERLYHEALDLYLHPYLFFGAAEEPSARGLWGAVQVYQFAGRIPEAIEASRDIAELYPETTYAPLANQFLESQPPELLEETDAEQDARDESNEPHETEPTDS